MDYFSDRARGPVARTQEEVTEQAWGGLVAQFRRRIDSGAFGYSFPEMCSDGFGPCGTDTYTLRLTLCAEIPSVDWPLHSANMPETSTVFDLLEFAFRHVGEPRDRDWHSFMRHYHLEFDRAAGQAAWRDDVNRILQRSGIAYELNGEGRIIRVVPGGLAEEISTSDFRTGDPILDGLLDEARVNFVHRDPTARRAAVEKLWDAFERAKTLRDPSDKKSSAERLLNEVSSTEQFLQLLRVEAHTLTQLGNEFRIRHSEQGKVELTNQEFDYLFTRMFALLWHLLRGETPT